MPASNMLRTLSALVCLTAIATAAPGQPESHVQSLKVFLADFDDIPHPERYSREYFEQLFFSLDGPPATPEGRPLSGSVREYFRNISEGRIDISGEVEDWVRIPRSITKIPHWKHGIEPFGESWPVIVAETLRAHGIVGAQAKERVLLDDGRMPDLLVFLNTDFGMGGVNRGWERLKEVLEIMNLGSLWDDAWPSLPAPYSSYSATHWPGAPGTGPDGTIEGKPTDAEIEMFPLSVMMHEMGHQLAGWPDLYGPVFEPWGVFDLMGGPAAGTHFPMAVSSYLRVESGWMQYTDMPRRSSPGLLLHPLDTHKEALRFPQGPGQETIVVENRRYLKYPRDAAQPPDNEGSRLLLYRLDPAARRRMVYGDSPVGKVTTVIRRREHYGEMWGGEAFGEITAATVPSSRNSLGELWWEFRGIRPQPGGEVAFDAVHCATDLLADYCGASWRDGQGAGIEPGRLDGPEGDVCLVSTPDADGRHQRSLRISTPPGGSVRGHYELSSTAPQRLYLTVSLLRDAGCAASVAVAGDGEAPTEVLLTRDSAGQPRTLIVDLPPDSGAIDVVVGALDAAPTTVSIAEAWVVNLGETLHDPLRAAPEGTAQAELRDGCTYGPSALTVPVGEGAWSRQWEIKLPDSPTTLRCLAGLAADAGGTASVGLKLLSGEQEWSLLKGLVLDTEGTGWPAVLEIAIPAEALGKECRLELEVGAATGQRPAVVVPSLRVCAG